MAAAIRAASTEALGAESPCRVKLRVWRISNKNSQLRRVSSDSQRPAQQAQAASGSRSASLPASAASPSASGASVAQPALSPAAEGHAAAGSEGGITLESVLLTIPDAVLCSEMGVHLSPCGRFLAACIVCMQVSPQPALYRT